MKLDSRLLAEIKPDRRALIGATALGALAGALLVAQAWLLARIIDTAFMHHTPLADLVTPLGLTLVIVLLRGLALAGSARLAGQAAESVKHRLRLKLFSHLTALGPAYTAGERTGELTTTLNEGIEALDAYVRQYLPRLALAALVPLAILLTIFPLDLLSGVVLLLTAPLIPVFMILIGQAAGAVSRRQWQTLSRLGAHFLDVVQGLPTLKLLGMSQAQSAGIRTASERFRAATMQVLRVAFLSAFALEMIGTISTAVVAVEIAVRLLDVRLTFFHALFVLILAPEFYLPMRALGMSFHAATSGVSAAERIFEVLGKSPHPVRPAVVPSPLTQGEGGRDGSKSVEWGEGLPGPIRFAGVSVVYSTADGARRALDGVSFAIEPGQTVALVGPTGAGKSTIAGLLLRFREPDSGTITVGGQPLAAWSAADWRGRLAWVPQQPHLFAASAADNIRLGRPDASLEAVQEAARLAQADTFIRGLPQGYDTPLGERGARLSGGQAQRMALARAFLLDAPLLILDEPTAHLDPASQVQLDESIRWLVAGKTALIVAHHLSSVTRADRVIVMDGGRVVESGTHQTLLAAGGSYARLIAAGGAA